MLCRVSMSVYAQELLRARTCVLPKQTFKTTTCRSMHMVCTIGRSTVKLNTFTEVRKNLSNSIGISFIRHASTDVPSTSEPDPLDIIPDPPLPVAEEVTKILKYHANGEATFQSLGLGGWSPVGMVENCLEWLHIGCDLPWWGAVAVGTLCVRVAMFPLMIYTQRNVGHTRKHLPQMQELQKKMLEARYSGDPYEAALAGYKLQEYCAKYSVNPLKSFTTLIVQVPVFISFFLALRGMASLPVESLKTGGLWWFTDLTVPDPYYILPMITVTTVLATLELGVDSAAAATLGKMKYVIRAVPFVMFPFIIHFPGIVLCYWVSTNFISLIQASILRIPAVSAYLKIPRVQVQPQNTSSKAPSLLSQEGFINSIKEGWTNIKISRQMRERDRADVIQFQAAGKGPLPKTFRYNPKAQATSVMGKKN